MLEFQAIHTGSISAFHVKMVGIVVVRIHDPNTERGRVAKGTVIDPIDVQMLHDREVAIYPQNGIDPFEILVQRAHLNAIIHDRFPKCLATFVVMKRGTFGEAPEALISYRDIALTPVAA